MKVLIIGADIGGLSTALALAQVGFDVDIHEQAPRLEAVGAGPALLDALPERRIHLDAGCRSVEQNAVRESALLSAYSERLNAL